ncbi:MAG TPA: LemA family protein [Caulobacteraceae bacterium]|jgi:LemA protein|nr:LemA family protein [Caulobacteraceae bacterium]
MLGLIIVIAIVVLVGVLFIGAYNRLVALRQNANEAFADIDVQLKQRQDLVPNLVETVKGYAAHERGTLDEVTQARAAAASAGNLEQRAQAETALTGALGRLMAVAESYPDLKANQNFLQLQSELADLENKIAAARRFFNNAVGEYNASIQRFPAVLIASMTGFASRDFFDAGPDRAAMQTAPQVKFS